MTNLFIFGTLKRRHGPSALLDGQHFLGERTTAPQYRLYSVGGSFPALVEADHADVPLPVLSIEGELWQVDDECLAMLDRVEGVAAQLFERRQIELLEHEGEVEAYFCLGEIEELKDCGERW